jgi:NPCBM/NEW2 domain-containing protein
MRELAPDPFGDARTGPGSTSASPTVTELELVVTTGGDGDGFHHADWARARVSG